MSRILILYTSQNSGHHSAALAVEAALKQLDPSVETMCVDPIKYAHPNISALIHGTYMGIIRRTPELWDALYDNGSFEGLTRRIRGLVQRGKSRRFVKMINDFAPDAVICTQAYPFGVMQAYMENTKKDIRLWGVITDYRPHRFWVYKSPANYIVPNESAVERLVALGINAENIMPFGIPVNPSFLSVDPPPNPSVRPQILIMGGNQGIGIKAGVIKKLDASSENFIMHIITGKNRRLRKLLMQRRAKFAHPVKIKGYVRVMPRIMRESCLLISKPGGLTCAESCAIGLPMIIMHALPGQESGNTDELVGNGAAIQVKHEKEIKPVLDTLLGNPEILAMMAERSRAMGKPDAAFRIAEHVLRAL